MRFPIAAVACLLFLLGCQKPDGRWEVLQELPVFKAADERDEIGYTLQRGEICVLGAEQVVKVFMYRRISCRRGVGWIRYDAGYPLRKID